MGDCLETLAFVCSIAGAIKVGFFEQRRRFGLRKRKVREEVRFRGQSILAVRPAPASAKSWMRQRFEALTCFAKEWSVFRSDN